MIRLVLFDIDGTLILTGGAGMKAFAQVFAEEFGLPHATESMVFAGRTDRALVFEIFRANHIEPNEEKFNHFAQAYTRRLNEHLPADHTEPLPGVCDFLDAIEAMQSPPILGLLTGNLPRGAELKLSHYNLWHRFQFGAFGDTTEDRNEIAKSAYEQARPLLPNLTPIEILIIGDTPADIQCGQAIGAPVLAVATGNFSEIELAAHHPTHLAPDLKSVSTQILTP